MTTSELAAAIEDQSSDVPTVSATVTAIAAPVNPRMRGRLHAGAAIASVATGAVLVAAASLTSRAVWPTAIYSTTILALFTISGLYHRRDWQRRGRAIMRRLDHSMIFVFIAGTYTPIAALALPHDTAVVFLSVVWGGAAAGVVLKMFWPSAPRWVGVPLYIGLGWTAVFVFPEILRGAGLTVLLLIIAGGLAYTLGAVTYAIKRPDPWPATFGFHEVFHACTIVAATCHYIAIWLIVL